MESCELTPKSAISKKRNLSSTEKLKPKDKKPKNILSDITAEGHCPEMGENSCMAEILKRLEKLDRLDGIEEKMSKLQVIENDIKDVKNDLKGYQQSLEFTQTQLSEVCESVVVLEARCDQLESLKVEIDSLKEKNNHLEQKLIEQETYSRRENVIVSGLQEVPREDCFETAQNMFIRMGVGPFQLQRCHRLGSVRTNSKNPRLLIIRFVSFQDKISVMKNRTKLKGTNVFVNDDFPQEIEKKRAALRPLMRYAKQHDPSATLVLDKLRINGTLYSIDTMNDSPIDMTKVGTLNTETHIMFAGEFSPLSNLYPCCIATTDVVYISSEQFY